MGKKKHNSQKKKIFNLVDIVYPVYGQYPSLERSIATIPDAAKDISYRIYIVDDCSPDYEKDGIPTYNRLRTTNPNISSISHLPKNGGYARAANSGANQGTAKFILLMSTDVFLHENAIKIMAEHLDANPDIGIISPLLLFPPELPTGNRVQHAGMAFDIEKKPYHLFMNWPPNHPLVNVVRDLNIITGACFLIRRNVWQQLKGYSLDYGKGTFEDMDLCIRTRLASFKIRFLPQARGYHHAGLSVLGAKESYPMEKNSRIFYAKFGDIIPYDDFLYSGYL